jgi:hypothetical protein
VRSSRLSIGQYLRTTRACKLYDFEAGVWLSYDAVGTADGGEQRADP